MSLANDPLLQPFQLKHLRLRNRIMTSSHEPAYAEDGLPKARYRAYHVERAKAGIALTMTAGSAAVSRDSPPVFNNILAYKDEVVPWMRDLTDACHEHGAAVMIQITHLGRRTSWSKADWLPVVSPSHHREASHRAFPKQMEDWDISRIIRDYADAAERMHAAGVDGVELEAYGHLMDQFWSPATNTLEGPYGGPMENRVRFTLDVIKAIRARVGPDFILGVRGVADEVRAGGLNAGLISVRPDDDFAAGERSPVGELRGLAASRPCHDDSGRDAAGSVGCFLSLDDQHASVGVGRKQVQPVKRSRFCEGQPAPFSATSVGHREGKRDDLLAAGLQVEPANVADCHAFSVTVGPD